MGAGVGGSVFALAFRANGELYAGGDFTTAGGVSANRVAKWNGTAWSALGSGITGDVGWQTVRALAILPAGDLVVGGGFNNAGGNWVNGLARWNGTSWVGTWGGVAGPPTYSGVFALLVRPNGDLVVGGAFSSVAGVAAVSPEASKQLDVTTTADASTASGYQVVGAEVEDLTEPGDESGRLGTSPYCQLRRCHARRSCPPRR